MILEIHFEECLYNRDNLSVVCCADTWCFLNKGLPHPLGFCMFSKISWIRSGSAELRIWGVVSWSAFKLLLSEQQLGISFCLWLWEYYCLNSWDIKSVSPVIHKYIYNIYKNRQAQWLKWWSCKTALHFVGFENQCCSYLSHSLLGFKSLHYRI